MRNFWPWSPLEASEWVNDPGNGLKSIKGSWRDHFGGISGVKFSNSIFSKSPNLPILSFWILIVLIIIGQETFFFSHSMLLPHVGSKEMFLAHFLRIQTSKSYFLFDERQTLPIAANDEEISNFAYHGK